MQHALLIYSASEARAAESADARATGVGVFDDWIAYTRALKSAGRSSLWSACSQPRRPRAYACATASDC